MCNIVFPGSSLIPSLFLSYNTLKRTEFVLNIVGVGGWVGEWVGARNWNIEITFCQPLFCFSRSLFGVSSRAKGSKYSERYNAYLVVFLQIL
jgi:hypothetical protein